eukprot:9770354-Lingulodinium_polyedra.AAC.1
MQGCADADSTFHFHGPYPPGIAGASDKSCQVVVLAHSLPHLITRPVDRGRPHDVEVLDDLFRKVSDAAAQG